MIGCENLNSICNTASGDFHLHTVLSDGSSTAREIFEKASKASLSYISITDHDFLPPDNFYDNLEKEFNITNIRGVEISSMDTKRHRRVHILCYLPIYTDEIEKLCEATVKNRMEAGMSMAKRVSKLFPIDIDEVIEIAGASKSIFKQHIMLTLIKNGFADSIYGETYSSLFSEKQGSCLIDCLQPDTLEVVSAVRKSGGICVMAHPHTYKGMDFLHEALAEGLLDGIEVWSGKTNSGQEAELLALAQEYDVIPFGGTDFHGDNVSRYHPVGYKQTPKESIDRLLSLSQERKKELSKEGK